MAEDKILKCKDCGKEFAFTAGEQEFYAQKGFQNEPARCSPCRQIKKRERSASIGGTFREGSLLGGPSFRTNYGQDRY